MTPEVQELRDLIEEDLTAYLDRYVDWMDRVLVTSQQLIPGFKERYHDEFGSYPPETYPSILGVVPPTEDS